MPSIFVPPRSMPIRMSDVTRADTPAERLSRPSRHHSWRQAPVRCRLCVPAVETVERRQDGLCLLAGERIVDRLRRSARLHQAVAAQPRQVLGERRLAEADQPFKLTHVLLAVQDLGTGSSSDADCPSPAAVPSPALRFLAAFPDPRAAIVPISSMRSVCGPWSPCRATPSSTIPNWGFNRQHVSKAVNFAAPGAGFRARTAALRSGGWHGWRNGSMQ